MQTIRNEIARHLPQAGEARRLFHGRGHTFEDYTDVVIDVFPPVTLIVLYRERPKEWIDSLIRLLLDLLPETRAVLLQKRYEHGSPCETLWGVVPDVVEACEGDLRFRLRLGDAQNVGFFPDMAVGRGLLRRRAAKKKVLNLFAYTSSFSVAALAGGAEEVVNVDMNRGALELGRLNHQINGCDLRRCSFLNLEIFKSFSKLRRLGPFDVIICDPPSSQGKSFTADRHWPKLIRRLPELLSDGGEVLACLNAPHLSPEFLIEHFEQAFPGSRLLGVYPAGFDYPESRPERGVSLLHFKT